MENIQIQDESGDHKYFTLVPNYILNHSTAVAQALYLQLKRLAGENGTAYPGRRYLMEKMGVSYNTLKKEFKYLLDKGWIKFNGYRNIKTEGGNQKVKSYKIVDLWDLNNKHYQEQRGVKIEPPCERGVKIEPQGVSTRGVKIEPKEEPPEEEPYFKKNQFVAPSATSEKKEFCFKSKMQEMRLGSARRTAQIIALYWDYKGIEYENEKQYQAGYKRELKAANLLTGYSNDRIEGVMMWLNDPNNCDFNWKLETIHKLIDQPNLKSFKKQPQASGSLY